MFWENREFNGRIGRIAAFWTALLGGVGTVSVGLSGMNFGARYKLAFTIIALLATSAVTSLQSWIGFLGHRQAHIFYSNGHTLLWQHRRELEHIAKMEEGESKQRALRKVFDDMQKLLMTQHEEWKKQQLEATRGDTK
jgi:hypothetical protein